MLHKLDVRATQHSFSVIKTNLEQYIYSSGNLALKKLFLSWTIRERPPE